MSEMKIKTVLTIAGSDSIGGAGIQADIKTITIHHLYAMSVITAITAQNTMGVQNVQLVQTDIVTAQLESILSDIRPDAVKIGMLGSKEIAETVVKQLEKYNLKHIVIDPVLVSTSGRMLLETEAVSILIERLFPLAEIITPNIPEAEYLYQFCLKEKVCLEELQETKRMKLAQTLSQSTNGAILIKGGHSKGDADDFFYKQGESHWFSMTRFPNQNTHGTGCTLSSAIACGLAKGYSVLESVRIAKEYITKAIKANLQLGHGIGPLNHMVEIQ